MSALRLEVFETDDRNPTVVTDRAALEEARRVAFDEGMAAGRAAALAEAEGALLRREQDLAQNLQALSFTFHEARAHVLGSLRPLLESVVVPLLPAIAYETLPALVAEALAPLAEEQADAPARLSHHPDARDAVRRLIAQGTLPLNLHEDATLPPGAVHLQLGKAEARIDPVRATQDITAAIRGFFELTEQDRRHG